MRTQAKNVTKKVLPSGIRQQVWLKYNGRVYESKCNIIWCKNVITVFNYHVGHDIPKSKGGESCIDNLRPICSNCNTSMSNNFTIDEWNNKFKSKRTSMCRKFYDFLFK